MKIFLTTAASWLRWLLAVSTLTAVAHAEHNAHHLGARALSHRHSGHGETQLLLKRDAYNQLEGDNNQDGGTQHGPLRVPSGSRLRNFTVGNNGEELVTYWSNGIKDADVEMAIIMIHGRERNGGTYWTIANNAFQDARRAGFPGARKNTVVIATQFFSKVRNSGQYASNQIAFADVNAWQAGERATHPSNTQVTSFSALDVLLERLALSSNFPNLSRVVIVGHGGGGQMISRYAIFGAIPSGARFSVRYVVGDPSSNLYYGPHRPLTSAFDARGHSKDTCPLFNTYRYGFDGMDKYVPSIAAAGQSPKSYFARFAKRDVVFLVANADTDASGDQTCMGILLGGVARRDRNFAYWVYLNKLAGTRADLSAFRRAKFSSKLPDWSDVTGGSLKAQLGIVADAGHDPSQVFGHSLGRAALFTQGKVPAGARPA